MRKILKISVLVIIMTTLTGCKDKTQMILYDYSHKGIKELPTNSDDSEIKRILRGMRFDKDEGGGGEGQTPVPPVDEDVDDLGGEEEEPPEYGPVLPPGWND